MWGILYSMVFCCKLGVYSSSERPQKVAHEVLLKFRSKSGFKWKQRGEFTEERIDGPDI